MRTLLHLLLCAALATGAERIARNGGFGNVDDAWIAWLRANVERVTDGDAPSLGPLIIEITEGGGATDSWPPTALDYALVLDRLAVLSPRTVALGSLPPLPGDALESEILSDKAAALPGTVFPATLIAPPPLGEPDLSGHGLRELPVAGGDLSRLPLFSGVISPPTGIPGGFTSIDLATPPPAGSVHLLARTPDGKATPSFALTALLEYTGTPAAETTVTLGKTLQLGRRYSIPLAPDGSTIIPPAQPTLPRLDAGNLFNPTGSTAPETSPVPPLSDRLLYIAASEDSPAIAAAHIASAVLGQDWVRPLPRPLELALWALLSLAATASYRSPARRGRLIAFSTSIALILAALFAYSSVKVWAPLPAPAALVALMVGTALLRRTPPTGEAEHPG